MGIIANRYLRDFRFTKKDVASSVVDLNTKGISQVDQGIKNRIATNQVKVERWQAIEAKEAKRRQQEREKRYG